MASDFRFVYNIVRVIFPKLACSNFATNHSKKNRGNFKINDANLTK